LTFLSTLRRRRNEIPLSEYPDRGCSRCAPGSLQQLHCPDSRVGLYAFRDGYGIGAGRDVRLARPQPGGTGHDVRLVPATHCAAQAGHGPVLILVFVPFISARQGESEPPFNFAVEIPFKRGPGAKPCPTLLASYARSFWTVFRVAFPLMILAAVLGAFAVELLPQQALTGSVTVVGIIAVALVSAFLPVPMALIVANRLILMTKGVPLPYVAVILCTLGIISVYSLAASGKDYLVENCRRYLRRHRSAGDCGRFGRAHSGMNWDQSRLPCSSTTFRGQSADGPPSSFNLAKTWPNCSSVSTKTMITGSPPSRLDQMTSIHLLPS